jgi:hypothetical protein
LKFGGWLRSHFFAAQSAKKNALLSVKILAASDETHFAEKTRSDHFTGVREVRRERLEHLCAPLRPPVKWFAWFGCGCTAL